MSRSQATFATTAAIALAACGALSAAAAQAAPFPDHPLKMIVGFSAGGGTDVAARLVAQAMTVALHQSVVVENRPGASGMLATADVARAAPDGYTLLMGSQTTLAVAPALYRKFAIDAARDFAGVARAGASPLVLVVNPKFPAHSVAELIALAKAKPGTLNFASGGVGTTPHMAGELFAQLAGIKLVHVAYRGEAPALNDVLSGQIPMMFTNVSAAIGNIQAGSLRALAVTGAQRSPIAPDIPTLAEAAIPNFAAETWFAVVAPAHTPRAIVDQLNAQVQRGLAAPDFARRYADLGMSIGGGSPEELDAYIKSEIDKWGKVIESADIRAPE
ncbi:MAG TPA: tripartite tricarboxylate transporter substrate binding protein [Xanthobacteraceae bacterium]|nr:tripartite tricarboxylate transporter substrate binding protein [Xanthobacteraceae bacterium]